ncbi:hypothetical protein THAOC_23138, partial [Thalassiosira oceanica]
MRSEPSSLPAVASPDLARQPQHWPRSSDDILESLASADLEPLHTTADEELSGGGDLDTVRSEISSLAGGGGGSLAVSAVGTIAAGVRQSIAHWRVLLFGQGIALSFALAGAASEELNGVCGVSIPLSQTSVVAVFLSAMGAVMHARSQRRKALRIDEHSLALHESSDSTQAAAVSGLYYNTRSMVVIFSLGRHSRRGALPHVPLVSLHVFHVHIPGDGTCCSERDGLQQVFIAQDVPICPRAGLCDLLRRIVVNT